MNRLCSSAMAAVLALGGAAAGFVSTPAQAAIAIGVSVGFAPPALPIYAQPPIPGPDYMWTPGYWAWSGVDYYWVPGAWVMAPDPGLLWTPAWWGWDDGVYLFHAGYWGPTVGFYGGIAYGFGYNGSGYQGGYWNHNHFFYNRTVNNFGATHITNVYSRPVANAAMGHVSFNGPGGVRARPTPQQMAAANAPHTAATAAQVNHQQMASRDPGLKASVNHGVPPIAATARAAVLTGAGVVAATRAGAAYHAARTAANATRMSPHAVAARPAQQAAAGRAAESRMARAEPAARPAQHHAPVEREARAYHPPVSAHAYHAPAMAYRSEPRAEPAMRAPRSPAMAEFHAPAARAPAMPHGGGGGGEHRHGPGMR